MAGTIFLEGEKINLRPVEEEDVEFLADGVNHPEVRVHMGNRKPQNLEKEQDFFEDHVCGDDSLHLLICRDEEPLGVITLMKNETEKVGKLGIWIHPDHHGNGYGTEASQLLIDHCFDQLNYHKLWASVHSDNKPSQNVWRKLGFEKEAELRDHTYVMGEYKDVYKFGLLRGDRDE